VTINRWHMLMVQLSTYDRKVQSDDPYLGHAEVRLSPLYRVFRGNCQKVCTYCTGQEASLGLLSGGEDH
jgi:hypothetical protein